MNNKDSHSISSGKFFLIVLILFLTVGQFNLAEGFLAYNYGSGKAAAKNIHYTVTDQKVFINYDLYGKPGKEYTVKLILRRESKPGYSYIPAIISGDVGKDQSAGKNKLIVWNIGREIPGGLEGKDYYFEITVHQNPSGSGLLTWLGIGAAAVAATATYFILSNNSANHTVQKGAAFPPPPGRP